MNLYKLEKTSNDMSRPSMPREIARNPEVASEEKNKLQKNMMINGIKPNQHINYRMDSGKTIDNISKKMSPQSRKTFNDEMNSGENPRVKLLPKGAELYRTGNTKTGSFFTEDHPGKTRLERMENLQLPPKNSANNISKLRATKPQLGIESTIKAQPDWAKEAGYQPRSGMKQIYIPHTNPKGALAEGRFENVDSNKTNNIKA